MELNLSIHGASWETVITIPQGTLLEKSMKSTWYKTITTAAGQEPARFGCYIWRSADEIFYCGEFAKDYKHSPHNFQARIHNYLMNHRIGDNGFKNTNLIVFERINESLNRMDITLSVFRFEYLQLGDRTFDYADYTENADLVHLVEAYLITYYRLQNQCQWNRT